jgi:hypothetical protein
VAEHNADYRAYVEAEMARRGSELPLIRSQNLLESVEGMGRFLSETQLAQLRGDHARLVSPPARSDGAAEQRTIYVAGIDVAGEDEEAEDAALRSLKPRKDSTAVTICAVTWDEGLDGVGDFPPSPPSPARGAGVGDALTRVPSTDSGQALSQRERGPALARGRLAEPTIRIVQHYWWTGRKHRELFPQLVDLLKQVWHCRAVVVDATGVGAGVASFLVGALPGVARPFLFTAASKSALGYGLLAAVNGGRLKMYGEPPDTARSFKTAQPLEAAQSFEPAQPFDIAQDEGRGAGVSPESAEFWREMQLARSTLHENQRLSFYVDPREGHDDFLMSAALAVEAAAGAEPRVAHGLKVDR